jgi:hypothetical protein
MGGAGTPSLKVSYYQIYDLNRMDWEFTYMHVMQVWKSKLSIPVMEIY